MKRFIYVTVYTSVLFVFQHAAYAQNGSDKIIFLTDLYETFIDDVKTGKNISDTYKETIQDKIVSTYFSQSEYGAIVNELLATPIKDTAALRRSIKSIHTNEKQIRASINNALYKSRQLLNNDSIVFYVIPINPLNRPVIEAMSGVMGLTAGATQIVLAIESDIQGWESMLEYAVAHEYNHAYWTKINAAKTLTWTLLDYLVFEGRGDYFAHTLYPNVVAPWTMALSENQKLDLWNKIKPTLQSQDMGYHIEVMFGSPTFPVWGGYSLGYDIVQSALKNNQNLTPAHWTNYDASALLQKSRYKD